MPLAERPLTALDRRQQCRVEWRECWLAPLLLRPRIERMLGVPGVAKALRVAKPPRVTKAPRVLEALGAKGPSGREGASS